MSTHSDAVSSKCLPAPRWSGSSSASLRRQATTRCWKGCKGKAGRGTREAGSAVLAAAVLLIPALLFSQQTPPKEPRNPEVVNLTLKDVHVVRRDEVLPNIYTTATYCNRFNLKPLCIITKTKY